MAFTAHLGWNVTWYLNEHFSGRWISHGVELTTTFIRSQSFRLPHMGSPEESDVWEQGGNKWQNTQRICGVARNLVDSSVLYKVI
jgi:hypothetical protein